jgi:hypothetical protein
MRRITRSRANWSIWCLSIPSHSRQGNLVGQIEGQEAAKGNVLPFNDLPIEQGYAVLTENLRHFEKGSRRPGPEAVAAPSSTTLLSFTAHLRYAQCGQLGGYPTPYH